MTGVPLIELRHRGGFCVSLANGHRSLDRGTVQNNSASVLILQAGTVLAELPGTPPGEPAIYAPLVHAGVVGSVASAALTSPGAGFASIPAVSAASGQGANFQAAMQALGATPTPGSATASYQPNDTVVLGGGAASVAAVLAVLTTTLGSATPNAPGTGYTPGDTIVGKGGTPTSPTVFAVASTKVVSATIANPGAGGTNGAAVVTGTTGTGTRFQANVTIANGSISAVNSIALAGAYTVNPNAPAAEPVTGGNLAGATLNVVLGVNAVTIQSGGAYTANAPALTQGSTSGAGVGATFNGLIFAPLAVSVVTPGSYTALPPIPDPQGSTSGNGAGATFTINWCVASVQVSGGTNYDNGDALVFAGGTPTTPAAGTIVTNTAGDLVAAGILYDQLYMQPNTVATSAIVNADAEVNGSELIWDPSLSALDQQVAISQLFQLGIKVR
jgi:hypothetical protein